MRHSTLRVARLAASICVLAGMAACTAVKTYPGPPRPNPEVAILESGSRGRILEIDGRKYTTGSSFALLPGEHKLRFELVLKAEDANPEICPTGGCTGTYGQASIRATEVCDASLVAEAGHRYRIVRLVGKSKLRGWQGGPSAGWGYTTKYQAEAGKGIVDVASDELVGSIGPCEWESSKI